MRELSKPGLLSDTTVTRRFVNAALLHAALEISLAAIPVQRRPSRLFDFAIAGGFHHGLRTQRDLLRPGLALSLTREPRNPYDSAAVAVRWQGERLGYLPRVANEPVAHLLDRGATVEAVILRMLDARRDEDVPDDLVFTSFTTGDPMIRLVHIEA